MLRQIVLSFVIFGGFVSAQLSLNDVTCGVKGPHTLALTSNDLGIIGGEDAAPYEFPWQGALLSKYLCGASILNNRWIITAAHCVCDDDSTEVVDAAKFKFIVGSLRYRGNTTQPRTVVQVEKVIRHPNYNLNSWNDVALLKLKEALPLTDPSKHLAPICLPKERPANKLDYLAGTKCITTGWGVTSPKGDTSEILQRVNIFIWKQSHCARAYRGHSQIINSMICAAAPRKDSCQGDSGGPLICYDDGKWRLVGLTSWGEGCAELNYPGVYTRVTEFLPWIKKTIANN